MNQNNTPKGNLNDIPYEIENPLDGEYFIDSHSILRNIFVFFYVLFFLNFSIFAIHKCIYSRILINDDFFDETYINITKQPLFLNFTENPFRNIQLKLKIKLFPPSKYDIFDALFNITTSSENLFSSITFSHSSYQQKNNREKIHSSNNDFYLTETIFDRDMNYLDFLSIQSYFPNPIQNYTKSILTIEIMHNSEHDFILYSNLYFFLIIILYFIIKIFKLKKIDELSLNQFIPLLYLSFCATSLLPNLFINLKHSMILQKMSEACLSTLFYEISFSFIFFSIYSLPFNFLESFLDFFLSALILFYSLVFQVLKTHINDLTLDIFLSILYTIYLVRNLQKGFFWYKMRTKETFLRGVVYTFVNIITTTLLIFCDFIISKNENIKGVLIKFISLLSYGITMSIYNLP